MGKNPWYSTSSRRICNKTYSKERTLIKMKKQKGENLHEVVAFPSNGFIFSNGKVGQDRVVSNI